MKTITTKIDDQQEKLLSEVSRATHVPKAALIRKGIDLVLAQTKEDIITPTLRRQIDRLLSEDHELLNRLAKA